MQTFRNLFMLWCVLQFGTHLDHLTTADEKPLRKLLRTYVTETKRENKPALLIPNVLKVL